MATKDITDRQCVEAAVRYHARLALKLRGTYGPEILAEATGQPYKVCIRAYERAVQRGYLDFGVSLRTAWATPEGKELLK